MIKIGLNGFGRIGRAVTRLLLDNPNYKLTVINELDPDIENIAYLLKYDSIYGRLEKNIQACRDKKHLICDDQQISVYSFSNSLDVPWDKYDLDLVIDATGVKSNCLIAPKLTQEKVNKVIITHSPPEVDLTVIMGVNDSLYNPAQHHVVSSSICDANAIAPALNEINQQWGIEQCFVTTLHPWLSYQNVLDGFVSSVASPGHYWKDYSLGRASVTNLIPKDTTAAKATLQVLPELEGKLDAISFRVPTHMVSASDITLLTTKPVTVEEINHLFSMKAKASPVFGYVNESLVSIDYLKTPHSLIVDGKRTKVLNGNMVKLVVWYDNEWGYSSRILDLAKLVATK